MFYFDDFYGKKVLKSDFLTEYDCFISSRGFVLTPGALTNLENEACENRRFLKEKLGCNEIITASQVHGNNIEIVKENKTFYENTDALISNIPNTVMLLNFADCVPVILYSKKDNAGALIHAGRRGAALNISSLTAEKMIKELNIKPENITALIGPAIGKCCYEIDEEVFENTIQNLSFEELQKADFYEKKGSKYFIDLKLLNYKQLAAQGIINIDMCSYCTACMSDIFYSYRKEKGLTARHSAVLKIKGG